MTTRVLAIDPSMRMLHCVLVLPTKERLCLAIPTVPRNAASAFRMLALFGFVQHVAYEECYHGKNTRTYAKLFHVQERMRECAEASGLTFEVVSPSTWRTILLKPGETMVGVKRATWKARAWESARQILGYTPPTQDFADAACLWQYVNNQEDLE